MGPYIVFYIERQILIAQINGEILIFVCAKKNPFKKSHCSCTKCCETAFHTLKQALHSIGEKFSNRLASHLPNRAACEPYVVHAYMYISNKPECFELSGKTSGCIMK